MIMAHVFQVEFATKTPLAMKEMTELVRKPPETGTSVTLMAAVQSLGEEEEELVMSTPRRETEPVALGFWLYDW